MSTFIPYLFLKGPLSLFFSQLVYIVSMIDVMMRCVHLVEYFFSSASHGGQSSVLMCLERARRFHIHCCHDIIIDDTSAYCKVQHHCDPLHTNVVRKQAHGSAPVPLRRDCRKSGLIHSFQFPDCDVQSKIPTPTHMRCPNFGTSRCCISFGIFHCSLWKTAEFGLFPTGANFETSEAVSYVIAERLLYPNKKWTWPPAQPQFYIAIWSESIRYTFIVDIPVANGPIPSICKANNKQDARVSGPSHGSISAIHIQTSVLVPTMVLLAMDDSVASRLPRRGRKSKWTLEVFGSLWGRLCDF